MTTPQAPEAENNAAHQEFPPTAAPVEGKKKRSAGKIVLRIVGLLVAAVVGLLVFGYFVKDDPSIAEVGNCVHNAGSDTSPNVAIVDCGAGNADFKVLKVVRTSNDKECDTVEGLEAAYIEKAGGDSFVLCLGKNH